MDDRNISPAMRKWMERTGQGVASTPAAYFRPDGSSRKPNDTMGDAREIVRLRKGLAVNLANSMSDGFGTFAGRGEDHPALRPHERSVPMLPAGLGEDLLGLIFG